MPLVQHLKGILSRQELFIYTVWFTRIRRDVLEGTWTEMIDKSTDEEAENQILSKRAAGNETVVSPKVRRQADFPGTPEQNQDNTK